MRECGLSEETAQRWVNEPQHQEEIDLALVADEGPVSDKYRIAKILPAGLFLLNSEPEPDLTVRVEPQKQSPCKRLRRALANGTWDLVKVSAGVLIGYLLKKYFP